MKITFLGTADGVVAANRYCSSILLETGENRYLIDAGAPVGDLLARRGIPYESVKALFNTHFHGDHIFGSLSFLYLIGWYYKDAGIDVYLPEQAGLDGIRAMFLAADGRYYDERVHLHVYGKDFKYQNGDFELTAIPTEHMIQKDRPAYAFLIKAEGKKLLFTGDMGRTFSDFPAIAFSEHFDLIVSECAHAPTENLLDVMHRVDCGKFVITHMNRLDERIPQIQAEINNYPFPVRMAEDDDEIIF